VNLPNSHEQQDAYSQPDQFMDGKDKCSVGLSGATQPETGKKHDKKPRSHTYNSQLTSIHFNPPLILYFISSFYAAL
jgi:hypothetical protein